MSTKHIPISADFIIIGGGTAGLILAAQLSRKRGDLDILVLEAAPDQTSHPLAQTPEGAFAAHDSELDWNYDSIPQKQLNDRVIHCSAGRSLSGATAVNYGLWLRGPKSDYDRWARLCRDDSWSYDSLLPYFRALETHYDPDGDREQHGFGGPIETICVTKSDPSRQYPLREHLKAAWEEAGVTLIQDHNNGVPLGLGEAVENWKAGTRQAASRVFDLSRVRVCCESPVARVLVKSLDGSKRATGVELMDGTVIHANKEVIISAGAYRTPGILMLSGIGPLAVLTRHGIAVAVDNPEVGANYFDHVAVPVYWKAAHPENNVAVGSTAWSKQPAYRKGQPYDFLAWESTPASLLRPAMTLDKGVKGDSDPYDLLSPERVHTESVVMYCPVAKLGQFPLDGTVITSSVLAMQVTSRGTVTIASADPHDKPVIDCKFLSTEADRSIVRHGLRRMLHVMQDTAGGKEMVGSQIPAAGCAPLTSHSSDEDLDSHAQACAHTWNHPAGTAAMQTALNPGVVDSKCRVHGVEGLRVVDASVLPVPIASHYMVCTYTLGWKVADMIAESCE